MRPGTENVALAAGFAAAFEAVASEREQEVRRLRGLRDEFARQLQEKIPGLVVNGDLALALPHMLNVSIPNIKSEYVVLRLDREGIAVSTKSACREGEEQESHVVAALGEARSAVSSVALAQEERAQNTLRFSLGKDTTRQSLDRTALSLQEIVGRIVT